MHRETREALFWGVISVVVGAFCLFGAGWIGRL